MSALGAHTELTHRHRHHTLTDIHSRVHMLTSCDLRAVVCVPSHRENCSIFSFRISSSTVCDRIFFGSGGCRGPQRVRFPVEGNTQAVAIVFGVNPQVQRATAASEAARSCDTDADSSVRERCTARIEVRRLLRSSATCFFFCLFLYWTYSSAIC